MVERKPPPSSSTTTPASSSSTETSYVNMTEVDSRPDVSLIGKHCEAEYCHQLDFLPFYCQSCQHTFCLDHRSETAHKCVKEGAWAARKRQKELAQPSAGAGRTLHDRVSQKPCAGVECKTTIGTGLVPGVHCDTCNRDYCLKHRMREEHNCKNLIPLGARPASAFDPKDRARSALDKLKAWGKSKQEAAGRVLPKPKPTSTAARLVAVNNLKKSAKGDVKLPQDKRVYLSIEAEAETTVAKIPKGNFFYSKDWVVGKVLDAASRSLQIQNVNNQSDREEDKLRVFHVEGGRILDFSEKLGIAVASGNTLVLLRGVGAA